MPEIVVAATIWESKNTFGFIDAVTTAKMRGFKFHVSWYGLQDEYSDYSNRCNNKIIDLGISDYIELKQKTKTIEKEYQAADYFCLPSFYEGTPNVICEAIASGKPVICSNVCDNGIYVKEGENGFLFDPKSVESMADGIEKALKLTNDEYQSYCRRSREMADELLGEDAFVEKYIKLIER